MPCNYHIGIAKSENLKISTTSKVDPNGNGSNLWSDLIKNGFLTENSEDKNLKDGKDILVAVLGQKSIKPGSSDQIEIGIVWDMPKIKFLKSNRWFTRFYTKYFDNGEKILSYALKNYANWEILIHEEWQREILDDM